MESWIIFCVCLIVVVALLFMAFQAIGKEKGGHASLFGVCAAAVLMMGIPTTQSFLKTLFTATVFRQLSSLASQMEVIQTTLGDMQSVIATNQAKLQMVQKEISEAAENLRQQQATNGAIQRTVVEMQGSLSVAQTNLLNQADRLTDLSYWVKHLFENSEVEEISLNDTNRVKKIGVTGGAHYGILLKGVPITNSLSLVLKGHGPGGADINLLLRDSCASVVSVGLYGYDERTTKILARYVRDVRRTNQVSMGVFQTDGVDFFGIVDGTNRTRINIR